MEHNLFLYFIRVVVHAFASYHNCTGSIPLMVSAPDVQKPLRFFEISWRLYLLGGTWHFSTHKLQHEQLPLYFLAFIFHKDLMILYFPIIKVEI